MSKERICFRVEKGCLTPADNYAISLLQERNYKVGDIVSAELRKPRSVRFNRFVHQLGKLVIENVEGFSEIDAHTAIKRLQIEGGIACDEIGVFIPNVGAVIQKIPRSFSFDSMGEEEYRDSAKKLCDFLATRYWKDCTPEQIERMADCMVD